MRPGADWLAIDLVANASAWAPARIFHTPVHVDCFSRALQTPDTPSGWIASIIEARLHRRRARGSLPRAFRARRCFRPPPMFVRLHARSTLDERAVLGSRGLGEPPHEGYDVPWLGVERVCRGSRRTGSRPMELGVIRCGKRARRLISIGVRAGPSLALDVGRMSPNAKKILAMMTVLVALMGESSRLCARACAIAPETTTGLASTEPSGAPVFHASTGCHGDPGRGSHDPPEPGSHDCELRCWTSALMPDVEIVQGLEPSAHGVATDFVAIGRPPVQQRTRLLARRAAFPPRSLLLMKSSLQI